MKKKKKVTKGKKYAINNKNVKAKRITNRKINRIKIGS